MVEGIASLLHEILGSLFKFTITTTLDNHLDLSVRVLTYISRNTAQNIWPKQSPYLADQNILISALIANENHDLLSFNFLFYNLFELLWVD